MSKIEKLTKKQEGRLAYYRDLGIAIGLSTDIKPVDEKLVRELTDKHRELCGVAKATYFIVLDSPFQAVREIPGLRAGNGLYGQHDSYWLTSHCGFYREELGLKKETEKAIHLYELSKLVGWMWMSSNTTIVTRKPTEIHLRKQGEVQVLHNVNGLALKYADGTGIYSMYGVTFSGDMIKFVTTPASEIKSEEVLQIRNTEQRTAVLAKIGLSSMFSKLKKKLIHRDIVTYKTSISGLDYVKIQEKLNAGKKVEIYQELKSEYFLYDVELTENVTGRYLVKQHPSVAQKVYPEAVDDRCQTVIQALAWANTGTVYDTDQEASKFLSIVLT